MVKDVFCPRDGDCFACRVSLRGVPVRNAPPFLRGPRFKGRPSVSLCGDLNTVNLWGEVILGKKFRTISAGDNSPSLSFVSLKKPHGFNKGHHINLLLFGSCLSKAG